MAIILIPPSFTFRGNGQIPRCEDLLIPKFIVKEFNRDAKTDDVTEQE